MIILNIILILYVTSVIVTKNNIMLDKCNIMDNNNIIMLDKYNKIDNNNIIEIAHRGHSEKAKDNSINSFESAISNDFDMIELDIQLTKDNIIVIYHDPYINDLLIKDINYSDIIAIDPDIIKLTYFLDEYYNNYYIPICLDIKGTKNIINILPNIITKYNLKYIYIGSFNIEIIEELYNINPSLNYGIITENMFPKDIIDLFVARYNIAFFSFHWSILNPEIVKYIESKNIYVFSYTCENTFILNNMLYNNVTKIITNDKIKNYKFY